MSSLLLSPTDTIDTREWVKHRHLDQALAVYTDTAHAVFAQIPDPWGEFLRAIPHADTPYELDEREYALIRAICDTLLPSVPAQSPWDKDRAPCPLCQALTPHGLGFVLPLGMERHLLDSREETGCPVLQAAIRLGHMHVHAQFDACCIDC